MTKEEKAIEMLREKVMQYDFSDDMEEFVKNILFDLTYQVEKEIGGIDDDGTGEKWYDEICDELREKLFNSIGRWLLGQ